MHFDLQQIIHTYGYVGIAGALFLEMIGIPFPGETLLTLSGIEWAIGTFSLLASKGNGIFFNYTI